MEDFRLQAVWKEPDLEVESVGENGRRRIAQTLQGRLQNEHPDSDQWKKDYTEETVEVKKMTLLSNPTHVYAKEPVVFYEMTELMKQADHEVLFHTPYIICNDWMMRQLVEVCEGEKEIRMMTKLCSEQWESIWCDGLSEKSGENH